VAVVFLLSGAAFANWVARIPAVKDDVGATAAGLGLALLGVALGSLVTMPLAGRLCERLGSRRVVVAGVLLTALSLPGPGLATSTLTLGLALAAYGAASGLVDVAMNVQAVAVVRRAGRPIMPWFHAAYSLGGLTGAVFGALAARAGLPPVANLAVGAAVLAVAAPAVRRHLVPDRVTPAAAPATTPPAPTAPAAADPALTTVDAGAGTAQATSPGPAAPNLTAAPAPAARAAASADAVAANAPPEARRRRPWALAGLGAIAACAALGEGAMADWSALFLRDERGAGAGAAALGYAAFAVAMTAGRLGGEAAIRRLGATAALRAGAAAATLGIVVAVVVTSPLAGMAGFGLVGLGLSCAFPLALTTAGESGDGAGGSEIARVSVVGYLGFLLGPPLIGFVADQVGLRGAVLAVALPALALVALAGAVDPARVRAQVDGPPCMPVPVSRRRLVRRSRVTNRPLSSRTMRSLHPRDVQAVTSAAVPDGGRPAAEADGVLGTPHQLGDRCRPTDTVTRQARKGACGGDGGHQRCC
jgi:MFS family permease